MNLHIGGTGGNSVSGIQPSQPLTIETLRAIEEYYQLEIQSQDAYDLGYTLTNQLSNLDTRIRESEFNSGLSLSPRRGTKEYNSLLSQGETWFVVKFEDVDDAIIMLAETSFVNLQNNGFWNIDTETGWFFLSPGLESKTTKPSSFSIIQNESSKTVSVSLTNTATSTQFYYVLTPVDVVNNAPLSVNIIN